MKSYWRGAVAVDERALVFSLLRNEWTTGPRFASKALNDMIAEGIIWRSWELIGSKLYPRYCLAHDVSELVIANDHST